jgi:hypothetical protein
MKDSWIFQNIKDNVNALELDFWQTYVQCYELNKVMGYSNMVFIQPLNKFCTVTKNTKDIQFVINNHPKILLFLTNKFVQKGVVTIQQAKKGMGPQRKTVKI